MTGKYELLIDGRPMLDKPYHLKGVGLPNVYLLNGVTFENDPNYGKLVTIEKVNELHTVIGRCVVLKQEELTGDEMRFLRKQIGMTQVELAKLLRVTSQTVANYEKGKTEKGPADMAMRMIYLANTVEDEDVADDCMRIASKLTKGNETERKALRKRAGHWSGTDNCNHAH